MAIRSIRPTVKLNDSDIQEALSHYEARVDEGAIQSVVAAFEHDFADFVETRDAIFQLVETMVGDGDLETDKEEEEEA